MIDAYCLIMTPAEFNWLRAWLNAGVSPEPESASIIRKTEELAALNKPKPQREFP